MENKEITLQLQLENANFINKKNIKKIEIDIKLDIPKKLYKYYSLSNYSLKGLKNSTIYFSHPHLLNDVMDGNFMLWNFTDFLKNFKKENESDIEEALNGLTEPFLKSRGIFSLSDNYKNELLWVHYTNEQGYCIEFETEKLRKGLEKDRKEHEIYFFPISYGDLKQINFKDYIIKSILPKTQEIYIDANLPILYSFAQKDKFWTYENEWRFLLNDNKFNKISYPITIINDEQKEDEDNKKNGGNIEFHNEIISKIILAPLFFNNTRFNKSEFVEEDLRTYNFKNNNSGKLAQEFLDLLKSQFNDKIYQVDKIVKDGIVMREIIYKIEIIDINEKNIKIKKILIKNGS